MKKVGIDFFTKVRFLSGLQSLGKELLFIETDTDMENNGAVPDIEVDVTPADEESGRDPQLEAAIKAAQAALASPRPAFTPRYAR